MTQTKHHLKLSDFLEHIPSSFLRTEVLEQLQTNAAIPTREASLREATAQLILDVVTSLYDINSSNESNINRICINLEATAMQLEHVSKEFERLERDEL